MDCLPPLLPAASGLVRRQVGPEGQSLHPGKGQEGQDGAGRAEPDRVPFSSMAGAGHHCVRPGRGKCFTPTLSSKGGRMADHPNAERLRRGFEAYARVT
jgi:hypothetical protein